MTEQLANPPIVEAVIDIDCEMPSGFNLLSLDDDARDRMSQSVLEAFAPEYSEIRHTLGFQHTVQFGPGQALPSTPSIQVVAIQAVGYEGKQIIQVRQQGFSFNRLAPYTTLTDYLPAVAESWGKFVSLFKPLQIRALRLRYINVLSLPTSDGKVKLDRYVKNGPQLADDSGLTVMNFLNQYSAVETKTGFRVNSTLTRASIPNDAPLRTDRISIVFDNSCECDLDIPPENWQLIEETVQKLRVLKNHTFESTLTPECLALFR